MTGSTRASWPSCYARTSSRRCCSSELRPRALRGRGLAPDTRSHRAFPRIRSDHVTSLLALSTLPTCHLHPLEAQGDQPVTVLTSIRDADHGVLNRSQLRIWKEDKKNPLRLGAAVRSGQRSGTKRKAGVPGRTKPARFVACRCPQRCSAVPTVFEVLRSILGPIFCRSSWDGCPTICVGGLAVVFLCLSFFPDSTTKMLNLVRRYSGSYLEYLRSFLSTIG